MGKYYNSIMSLPGVKRILENDTQWLNTANHLINQSDLGHFYGFDRFDRAIITFKISKTPIHMEDFKQAMLLRTIILNEYFYQNFGEKIAKNGVVYILDYSGFDTTQFKFWSSPEYNKQMSKIQYGALP